MGSSVINRLLVYLSAKTKNTKSPMPIFKNNTILSEVSIFFKNNDSNQALFTRMEMLKGINMSEKILFERESPCNSKYPWWQVLQFLVMFPCFMIKNPYNYKQSSLSNFCKHPIKPV